MDFVSDYHAAICVCEGAGVFPVSVREGGGVFVEGFVSFYFIESQRMQVYRKKAEEQYHTAKQDRTHRYRLTCEAGPICGIGHTDEGQEFVIHMLHLSHMAPESGTV